MRLRLQVWYAAVLLFVIATFAGALYVHTRFERMRATDARLEAAASYLQATLRGLPPIDERPGFLSLQRAFRARMAGERGPREQGRPDRGTPDGPHDRGPASEHQRAENHGPEHHGPPGPGPRPRGPGGDHPAGPPPGDHPDFPDWPPHPGVGPAERLRAAMTLPGSLLDAPDSPQQDWPYFKIWEADGTVLAESDNLAAPGSSDERRPDVAQIGSPPGFPPGFRWREPDRREIVVSGPRGSTILVGKPFGRELAEMRRLAWRLFGGGMIVMIVGLAGGWLISRSITQPIQAIATTASEISARNLARRIETSGLDKELVGLATILNEMFERLEGAFERQSRFTSDASHELRTPLAVLHAHAELALSRPRSAEEYRETLAACLKAAARMGTLVDGLLMLARADAGRLDPQFRRLDWSEVVDDVVDQYRPQAAAAGIELSTDLAGPVPVRGDAALLARVSSNLLGNALRYTPQGGRIHIALNAQGSDGAVLAVEDTGCGIAVEDQARVFERFFRADKARSRSQGGNGLGLAICKSLVEAHHGRIGFTSVPDQGTRFEVCLPLDGEANLAGPAPGATVLLASVPADSAGKVEG